MAYYFERKNDVFDVVDLTEKEKGGTTVIMPRLRSEQSAWRTDRQRISAFLADKSMEGEFILFSRAVNGITFTGCLAGSAVQSYVSHLFGGSLVSFEDIYSVYRLPDEMDVYEMLKEKEKIEKVCTYSRSVLLLEDKKNKRYALFTAGVPALAGFKYSKEFNLYIADADNVDRDELVNYIYSTNIRNKQYYVPYSIADGTEKKLTRPSQYIINTTTGYFGG
jgi:hypothetical protein